MVLEEIRNTLRESRRLAARAELDSDDDYCVSSDDSDDEVGYTNAASTLPSEPKKKEVRLLVDSSSDDTNGNR